MRIWDESLVGPKSHGTCQRPVFPVVVVVTVACAFEDYAVGLDVGDEVISGYLRRLEPSQAGRKGVVRSRCILSRRQLISTVE